MDSIVERLSEGFKEIVDATLSEDSQISDQQKEVLRTRFMSLFSDKLRLGLAYSFGQKEEEKPIVTEITPDDALMKENALLTVASRRKKYPQRGAKILKSVYSTNRKCLKELRVDTQKRKLEASDVEESDKPDEKFYESAAKKLKSLQNKVNANKEKTSMIIDAQKILKAAEDASAVRETMLNQ